MLSGLRQGWRIITVSGKDVDSQQTRESTRQLQQHARSLGPHNPPSSSAILYARPATTGGMRSSRRLRTRKVWFSPEKQFPSPDCCWWFQLEGSMADLPQSMHAGNEAQPLISCFELLAQSALLVGCLRSPLPTSGCITLRQCSDNVTAGEAIMGGFTTADPLRRFVQVPTRWSTFSRVKLEVDDLRGIDHEWADALSRNKGSIKGFFPPKHRMEFSVNDLLRPGYQPRRVSEHERWPAQLRKLEFTSAQELVPHCFWRLSPCGQSRKLTTSPKTSTTSSDKLCRPTSRPTPAQPTPLLTKVDLHGQ